MDELPKIYKSEYLNSEGISHGFFTRKGGASTDVYKGLNVGLGSDDERENVIENREFAEAYLTEGTAKLNTLFQYHSNKVITVTDPWDISEPPRADAMVTDKTNILLGIVTADCAPVLFADTKAGIIGAAHAGWKGALNGIVSSTIDAMVALGANRVNIKAAIGPCIAQVSYEVDKDFKDTFTTKNPTNGVWFIPGKWGRFQFDLEGFIENHLKECKIDSIQKMDLDTYKLETEFYSYRRKTHRSESDYGRQLSAICRQDFVANDEV
jgi:hypothetical protein